MAVDDHFEISFFSIHQGMFHGNQFLLVLSTELIFVTPVAGGAVGRANVWRFPCISFSCINTISKHVSFHHKKSSVRIAIQTFIQSLTFDIFFCK